MNDTTTAQNALNTNYPIFTAIIVGLSISLLNFLATKMYSYIIGLPKGFFWNTKYIPVLKLSPNLDIVELKKRLRIVIIDNEETFPTSQFKEYGYSIDYWEKVNDIKKLEDGFYDIIILDIGDVAKDISEDDGFGVMERLKSHNPAQIIIAYSGQSFDFSKNKFWELADDKIAKPSLFLKIEEKINNLIIERFNIKYYSSILKNQLIKNGIEEKKVQKIETQLYCSIKKNKEPNWDLMIGFLSGNRILYTQTKSICKTILSYFKI